MVFPFCGISAQCLLIGMAIFVTDFKVDEGGLSAGALAGIIISSCAIVILVLVALWIYICKKDVPDNGKVV